MRNFKGNYDKKKEIISKYDSTSTFYDKRYRKIQEEKYSIILSDFLQEKNKIILDAGCGSGLLFEFIVKKFKINHLKYLNYIGIEISLNMLKIFAEKCRNLSNNLNINLILSDIEHLPFRDNRIDRIYSITSLQNLPNIYKGIMEIIRVAGHMANLKFSILKKNLDLDSLISFLNPKLINLKIKNIESIEDIIIQGKLIKN
ncbi:MAG: class I SAM-dependent methyltransferase [Candidatus Hermodarchaeota archaeon]